MTLVVAHELEDQGIRIEELKGGNLADGRQFDLINFAHAAFAQETADDVSADTLHCFPATLNHHSRLAWISGRPALLILATVSAMS